MTLRAKTIFAILINISALIFALQFVFSTIVLNDFDIIEQNQMRQQVQRAEEAFASRIESLPVRMLDWANWDDSYAYMKNQNHDYVESNLITSGIVGLETNLILYVSPKGEVVFSKSLDFRKGIDTPFPPQIKERLIKLTNEQKLSTDTPPISGFIEIGSDTLIFGLRPILMSDGSGPPMGMLVWARYLSLEEIDLVSKNVKLPVSLENISAPYVHQDERAQAEQASNAIAIFPKDENQIVGYTTLKDYSDKNILRMRVSDSREIYQQGVKTRSSVITAIVLVGGLFGLLCIAALEFTVLKRIRRLSHGLISLGSTKNLSMRLPTAGSDELSLLGAEINNTLTALEENEHMIIVAREVAERATDAKSQFVSTMSHEIRTPLNGILGMMQVIHSLEVPEALASHLQVVSDCAHSLMGVINEVLDFSKIEAGKMTLESESFHLRDEVRRIINTVAIRARDKNLLLRSEVDENIPEFLKGDRIRLGQVLINLLGNAIKFTEKGEVLLSINLRQTHEAGVMLHFSVKDTGIGIPQEHQSKIFTAFTQADNSITRRFGGTGLGLTISKQIVELMGGSLTFVSEHEVGTTFQFTLDLPLGERDASTTDDIVEPISAFNILIVDDVSTNLTVAKLLLEKLGHTVQCLQSGEAVVDKFRHATDQKFCDVVFMDIQMPGMSGIEATRMIQNDREYPCTIPIVALTAHEIGQVDISDALDVKFAGWLTKPLNLSKIQALLKELFLVNQQAAPTSSPSTMKMLQIKGIDQQKLIETCLDLSSAYEVFEIFLEELPDLLAAFQRAYQDKDLKSIRLAAHALKGSLNNIGADLSLEAGRIELIAKKSTDFDQCSSELGAEKFIAELRELSSNLYRHTNHSSLEEAHA